MAKSIKKILIAAIGMAIVILMPAQLSAQKIKIDSLLSVVRMGEKDTNEVNALVSISTYCLKKGNLDSAWIVSGRAAALAEQIGFMRGYSSSCNNMAITLKGQGKYSEAINVFFKAVAVNEKIRNPIGISKNYNGIGLIYLLQNNYDESLSYFQKALSILEGMKKKEGQASILNNIGIIKKNKGEKAGALYYYQKALSINRELADLQGEGTNLGNIAAIYCSQKKYDIALENYLASLKAREEINDKSGIATAYQGLALLYKEINQFDKSRECFNKSLASANKFGFHDIASTSLKGLASLDSIRSDYKSAYFNFYKYTAIKDSLVSYENTKSIVQAKMRYEFDKKEAQAKADQEKKDIITAQQRRKQRIVIYAVSTGLAIVLILAGIIFKSLQVSKRKSRIIATQKKMVEEKNKEITDNINYAKRLQLAILPPDEYIAKHLPDSFVLYKPKDIVSGDFYWMEVLDGITFMAACDCTGHGVSGAMTSIVCSNALNRAVKEFGLRDTGKILDKVSELVVDTFAKSGQDVQDGMDISLLAIDKEQKTIQWSGANNPLLYTHTGADVMWECAADKQPIGKFDNRKPFTTNCFGYQPNMIFYLFTDGYADQFGGEKGKKLKYSTLKRFLLEYKAQNMGSQKYLLGKFFEVWKGNLEQTDDVLILGIKL